MATREVGEVVVAQNGYSYTYIKGPDDKPKRILTHWLVAEEKYGRPKAADERVVFKDGNRRNLKPENIEYALGGGKSRRVLLRKKIGLQDRMRELQAQLDDLEAEIKELDNGNA